ncbi:MAG: NAD(P)-dependent glycerol-3-phosphate dehydrogenase [Hydrogenobacter thermophilus]|uniref:NAD(P)H-dependent glycerol-3-phosphate dehydrogenase n=1 Tax=Hydrogenobacter thermophilus TaxID=940 RepID=UPI001C77990C|nr:NAD(P)H-dependent glycerol-3-phosphate dehydrogenase [Hydrogenobacter thermophilus]QWK19794.1 MAG: NAD(P)-dependent glycerol-3-phosphate dehydrogenase [Hydrogenobacter thermophilus]
MKLSILGGGRWGVALSLHLGKLNHQVLVYDRNQDIVREINRGNHPYMKDIKLKGVEATTSLKDIEHYSDYVIIALPVQTIREVIQSLDLSQKVVISASKGLEIGTYKRVSQIVKEVHSSAKVFCLSGPSFASEVSKGLPTALVLAGEDTDQMRKIRDLFFSENFRIYLSTDIVGVELGGALKNVVAIACGISDGLGYGENARASLITRGLAEMVRIGVKLGAKRETFYGLSGMGDLFLTASSPQSRNRTFGFLIGKGKNPQRAFEEIGQVVEGAYTVRAVKKLSEELSIYAPISCAVYEVIIENKNIQEVVKSLLLRPPKEEFEVL